MAPTFFCYRYRSFPIASAKLGTFSEPASILRSFLQKFFELICNILEIRDNGRNDIYMDSHIVKFRFGKDSGKVRGST